MIPFALARETIVLNCMGLSVMAMLRQPQSRPFRCREIRPEGISIRSQQQSRFPARVKEKNMAVFLFYAQIAFESGQNQFVLH
jgi:hypothetical protein